MDYPDAENALQLLLSKNHSPGPNTTYFSSDKVDKMFKQLMKTNSQNEKSSILKNIEDTVNEKLPWIMQYYSRNYILFHGDVKNFRQSDLIYNNYKYLKID